MTRSGGAYSTPGAAAGMREGIGDGYGDGDWYERGGGTGLLSGLEGVPCPSLAMSLGLGLKTLS